MACHNLFYIYIVSGTKNNEDNQNNRKRCKTPNKTKLTKRQRTKNEMHKNTKEKTQKRHTTTAKLPQRQNQLQKETK